MKYFATLKNVIGTLSLSEKSILAVAQDKYATLQGILLIILLPTISFIAPKVEISAHAIFISVSLCIVGMGIMVTHGLAKLMGGKASLLSFFNVVTNSYFIGWIVVSIHGFGYLVSLLSFLPGISYILGVIFVLIILCPIWVVVVNFKIFTTLHKLSTLKSVPLSLVLSAFFLIPPLFVSLAIFMRSAL